jgi:putative phosphoserine phosphatase/1-acylglycerol-3-phosphate O-acyltransferase
MTPLPDDRPLAQYVNFWIRASLGGVGFGLAVLWYVLLKLVPVGNAYRRQSFARMMARLCCGPCGVRVTVVGGERVGQHHPCVYASNHQSQIDYPITGNIFPGNALVMASQIGDWPVMGPIFRSSGSIALDRDVPVRAVAALTEAEHAIRDDGLSVWMFAEGTRGKTRAQLGSFKRGAFRLAAVTGVPIVPIVISPLLPETDLRGRRLTPHDVTIHVLEPVFAQGATQEDEDALRDEVRAVMQRTLSACVQAVE